MTLVSSPRRILALWLPFLPTERIFRSRFGRSWRSRLPEAQPTLVVSHHENNTQRIASLESRAVKLKLKLGMGIADARATHPSIEVVEAEPDSDRRLLESIADWCDRYTPLVAIDGVDGLFLDITGCAHLFGGEEAVRDDLVARLAGQGFDTRIGIASTPGAAWAAARFFGDRIVLPGDEVDLVLDLPLGALRLDSNICESLASVGLHTVGTVIGAPRAPLVRRFGKSVVLRLDQLSGMVEEAISPRLPVPELSVERRFADPVATMEGVEAIIPYLAQTLKSDLERRSEGVTRLQLLLFRVDGAVSRIALGTARPLRDPGTISRLFRERLATLQNALDVGYGFDLIRLSALTIGALDPMQSSLADETLDIESDTIVFADRIRARLGDEALLRPVLVQSHIPERASGFVPFAEANSANAGSTPWSISGSSGWPERPLRLFEKPDPIEMVSEADLQFRWRRATYTAARSEGPERIAPEWWRDGEDAPTRDYYRVEDEDGRRYWLFREKPPKQHETPPRWFLHGLSA